MPSFPNAQVIFQQRGSQEQTPLQWVRISPVSPLEKINQNTFSFGFKVVWDEPLTFSDGQPIDQSDFICYGPDFAGTTAPAYCPNLHANDGKAALAVPSREPPYPWASAYFKDS